MSFGRQPFVTGGTSWSVKNDTKYERIRKVNVPEQSSQSMSITITEQNKIHSLNLKSIGLFLKKYNV